MPYDSCQAIAIVAMLGREKVTHHLQLRIRWRSQHPDAHGQRSRLRACLIGRMLRRALQQQEDAALPRRRALLQAEVAEQQQREADLQEKYKELNDELQDLTTSAMIA